MLFAGTGCPRQRRSLAVWIPDHGDAAIPASLFAGLSGPFEVALHIGATARYHPAQLGHTGRVGAVRLSRAQLGGAAPRQAARTHASTYRSGPTTALMTH